MKFILFYISLSIGMISIIFLILPVTRQELYFWNLLRIRKLRHWVTLNKTQRWNSKNRDLNIIQISKKNIIWHILLTFAFSFLILQGQMINNFLRYLSQLLLIPIFVYFLGSIIQRQKIVVITIISIKHK